MTVFVLMFCYTLVVGYILYHMFNWYNAFTNHKKAFKIVKIITVILIVLSYLSPLVGFLLPISKIQKGITAFSNVFLGFIIYVSFVTVVYDIVKFILFKIIKVKHEVLYYKRYIAMTAIINVGIVFFLTIYGLIHAQNIKLTTYDVYSDKTYKDDNVKIALISDFHLGYSIGADMMEKMAKMVNKQDVDIILIAGDIFDNSSESMDDVKRVKKALSSMKAKYGKYAVFGNHDIEERLFGGFSLQNKDKDYRSKEMETILTESGITIVDDDVVDINGINLIGRKDIYKTGFGSEKRESLDNLLEKIDNDNPTILMEHEPKELDSISKNDIILHVAGHTHKGQFFPLTLGWMLKQDDNFYGLKKFNNMTSIVTSGVGVYGPFMRVGSDSEVVVINMHFNTEN